jgi:hypothetical protein
MRKRRTQPRPKSSKALGQQMLAREVGFGFGELNGQSLMLMQCVVQAHSEEPPQTITIGIPGGDADTFLMAAQRGVAMYKEHQAREGH